MHVNKNYIKGYYRLAIALSNIGELQESVAIIQKGLQLNPDHADLLRMHKKIETDILVSKLKAEGDSFFSHENYAGAIDAYSKTIDLIQDKVRRKLQQYIAT